MEKTAKLEIPYASGTDGADAMLLTKDMAERLEALLLDIPASQLGGGSEGELIVMQATGAGAYKAMNGDVTINKDGTTAIGALKVVTGMLADLAVTSAKLDNVSVLESKIANLAVSAAKLAKEAVEEEKIKNLAVGTAKLGNAAVTTEKLKDLAVTAAKIAEATITAKQIANNAIEAKHLIASAVTEAAIADRSVSSRKMKVTRELGEHTGASITLTEAWQTVTSFKITAAVSSLLIATASIQYEMLVTGTSAIRTLLADLWIDGAQNFHEFHASTEGFLGRVDDVLERTVHLHLNAGEHEIALKAKREAQGGVSVTTGSTLLGVLMGE